MMEKISIITVTYNNISGLSRTLESVKSQTYGDIEYIIVDGGSTDGSYEYLKSNTDCISSFVSEKDEGIYDAMNKGIGMASGEWLLFLNAGDTLHDSSVIENILSRDYPQDILFLYSDYELVDRNGVSHRRVADRNNADVHHQNVIYRRSVHSRYGIYQVTHPYIVSDLLLFLSVPSRYWRKIKGPISDIEPNGISDNGMWLVEQYWAAKIVYGMESIPHAFLLWLRTKLYRKRLGLINTVKSWLH